MYIRILCKHSPVCIHNFDPLFVCITVIMCRTSVSGFSASTMIVVSATPNTHLPWMVPPVDQARLAMVATCHK